MIMFYAILNTVKMDKTDGEKKFTGLNIQGGNG